MHAPATDRAIVNRLAHLRRTRGENRAFRLMKSQTAWIPVEPAMSNDTARLAFQVSHDVFIADIENATRRQDAVPMRHQRLVMSIIAAKLGQIVGMVLSISKQFGKAGEAGVDWIANRVNDRCVWQRQMNKAGVIKLTGVLSVMWMASGASCSISAR